MGAPETVPAGKPASSDLNFEYLLLKTPITLDTICITWEYFSILNSSVTLTVDTVSATDALFKNKEVYKSDGTFFGICTAVNSTTEIVFAGGLSNQITNNDNLHPAAVPITIDNDPTVFNVGRRVDEAQYFKGLVDEVRFYNKALTSYKANGDAPAEGETATSGEVVKNYKHGKGKHKN